MTGQVNREVLDTLKSGQMFVGERRCGKTTTLLAYVGLFFPMLGKHAPIVLCSSDDDAHNLKRSYREAFPGLPEPRWVSHRARSFDGLTGVVFAHECEVPQQLLYSPSLKFGGGVRSTLHPKKDL